MPVGFRRLLLPPTPRASRGGDGDDTIVTAVPSSGQMSPLGCFRRLEKRLLFTWLKMIISPWKTMCASGVATWQIRNGWIQVDASALMFNASEDPGS